MVELTSDQFVTGAGFQLSWHSSSKKSAGDITVSSGPYYANTPITFGFSGNADTYSWDFGNNKYSSSSSSTVYYKDAGIYSVQLSTTSLTSCPLLLTASITILADTNSVLNFAAYPNPSAGEFSVSIPKNTGNERLEVYSSLGQLLYKINPAVTDGRIIKMHLDAIYDAMYFITFISDEKPETIRVIISK